ncbi:hypothetical protein ARALYDRAFT_358114 [Arabidopsis lyrata subsp. lyrata]|uniref:Uncharacterized protein n=1 Tax=Arabidopsis lyrata subsp. lyrata TaxID=81972 RepID=D7MR48_ARALL|nr:elicitor peptide 2 [Arabidopsis lyrata subsp. lyrata]EFH42559.1 hypothetical protein ARALYDRAFT_358114 [Arabidopsis lyrata subsp. lyrata]|eukprot:XP_002866300.1 elicitor peptide 2 [Arabidopsis lyrata subsp. lyrata]
MEKLDRRSEEETYLWISFQFLDQTLIAIFKCLGILCQTAKETASSPVTLNLPEEENDVAMKDDVVLSTRGKKPKAKKRDKENTSKGRPGQTNKITLFSSINGSEIEKGDLGE